jgi:RNA polymerase sigma-70 factor (ECF subfamily)
VLFINGVLHMAEELDEFQSLMQRVREGSPEAAREVIDRYGRHIVRVIRRRLARRLRRQFDSVDFLQAVWASFFTCDQSRFVFKRPEDLMAFLATVARAKVIEAFRAHLQSRKHDAARELPLEALSASIPELATSEPTPSQQAAAQEQLERLQHGLPERHVQILELLRSGCSHAEIARRLEVSERTIHRLLQVLQRRVVA